MQSSPMDLEMNSNSPIEAGITCNPSAVADTLIQRIAPRQRTHHTAVREREFHNTLEVKTKYREGLLSAVRMQFIRNGLEDVYTTFRNLAIEFDQQKLLQLEDDNELPIMEDLKCAFAKAINQNGIHGEMASSAYLYNHPQVRFHPVVAERIFHPLYLLLLAYHLGGPVNAAYTGYAEDWQRPFTPDPTTRDNFYMQGTGGDMYENHRIMLVWEQPGPVDSSTADQRNTHFIFREGIGRVDLQTVPQSSYARLDSIKTKTIIFNAKKERLFHEPVGQFAKRSSITFDFRIPKSHPLDVHLSRPEKLSAAETTALTLPELLIRPEVQDYEAHFYRLLFRPSMVEAMGSKLRALVPLQSLGYPAPNDTTVIQQCHEWLHANVAHLPFATKDATDQPLRITDRYASRDAFLLVLVPKMNIDTKLCLGCDFFPDPNEPSAGHNEPARTAIRDLGVPYMMDALPAYLSEVNFPMRRNDLLSTQELRDLAQKLSNLVYRLIAAGHLLPNNLTTSFACHAELLGDTLGGLKELDLVPAAIIQKLDMQIFRSRCLHLFWCAEMVARCFKVELEPALHRHKAAMDEMAVELLRNYVAFCLFEDGMGNKPVYVERADAKEARLKAAMDGCVSDNTLDLFFV